MHLCLGLRPNPETGQFAPDDLAYATQLGVNHTQIRTEWMLEPTKKGPIPSDALARCRDQLDAAGIALAVVLLPQGRDTQYWEARLGTPGREREVEDVCESLRVIADMGVPVVEWTWSIPDVWGSITGNTDWGRGGARVRAFDYDLVEKAGPVTPAEAVSAEEMWERVGWFLERIVPVAEEVGVRLALHPHDPPTPFLRGEARVLGTLEGLRRLIELQPSPANGLNFCQGTVAEMGVDVIEAIRWFGERDRINHVHFRNVKGAVPSFEESFIDDGDTDMVAAMRAYRDTGYRYAMMPDHTPRIAGDSSYGHIGRAFALGYMRALMQALDAEEVGKP